MTEYRMPIPARVYNAAVGGHVCGPEDVDFGKKIVHLVKYDRAGNEVSFESQVTQANKIYVIHDDFTLSSNVTIPANCTLQFDGGSISGAYTIIGTNTGIQAGLVKIVNTNVILSGTWNIETVYSEWFGANGFDENNDTEAIIKAMNLAAGKRIEFLASHTYIVNNCIEVFSNTEVIINGIIKNILYGCFELFSRTVGHGGYTGYHDIYIHGNGVWDFNGTQGSGLAPNAFGSTPFRVHHCSNIRIEDITIKNWRDGHHAIEIGGSRYITIKNVKFLGVIREIAEEQVEAIQLETVSSGGTSGAIPYDGTITKDVTVDGCVFGPSEESSKINVAVGDHNNISDPNKAEENTFSNIVIKNCLFKDIERVSSDPEGDLQLLRFLSNYRNLIIENNIFENNTKYAIYVGDYSEHIFIRNNIFKNFKTITENEECIIKIKQVDDFVFINNTLDCIYESFMNIIGSDNISISNNLFKESYQPTIQFTTTGGNNVTINNNSFIDCGYGTSSIPIVWILVPITNLRIESNYTKLLNEYQSKPFHLPISGYSDTIVFKDNIIANASILNTDAKQDLYEQLSRFEYKSENVAMGRNYSLYFTDNKPVRTKGTTSDRPKSWLAGGMLGTENSISIGFMYFDTDLGKPIYVKSISTSSPYEVTWVDGVGTICPNS